ncbi:hypothetical protein D3C85_1868760 [compost metagenome]
MVVSWQAGQVLHPSGNCSYYNIPADPDDDEDEPFPDAGSDAVHDDGLSRIDLRHVLQLPVCSPAVLGIQ